MSSEQGRYDRKDGIEKMIETLHGLNELVRQRNEAGYSRHEQLDDFYILGRWHADTCGNFGKITPDLIPKVLFPGIPDVLTREEFWSFLTRQKLEPEYIFVANGGSSNIPSIDIVCGVCKQPWTIENCHDTVVVHTTRTFSLAEFVGRQLWEVQRTFSLRTDAKYHMQTDILIRNNRFIDLRPKPDFPTLKRNERGWLGKDDGVTGEYMIQSGDDGYINVSTFYHQSCNRSKLELDARQYFREIFERAGYRTIRLTVTPNQYCSCDRCAPWFVVSTEYGIFTIGRRKRVINIDWRATGKHFTSLFASEDVTMDGNSIHAWGDEKVVEYLTKIRHALSPVPQFC